MRRALRIGLVAGELSGDALGAELLDALAERVPRLEAVGVGGPAMLQRGLRSLYPMERLSVMGVAEPLRRLPELLRVRRALHRQFSEHPPDVFIGIDSPDFNLPLARRLRNGGLPTAHLVSPSVWAWRAGRVAGIRRSVDRMLCLFPFEPAIYAAAGVEARYVGHPMARAISPTGDRAAARRSLGLPVSGPLLALLPGSRTAEVGALGETFLDTAVRLQADYPGLHCALPAASEACRSLLAPALATRPDLPATLIDGRAREVMTAADAVLAASGTATLEAALLGRPLVVAYRTGALTWAVLSRLVRLEHVALPNILAGRELVPEFLQGDATPGALASALAPLLAGGTESMLAGFAGLRTALAVDFGELAADAILELVEAGRESVAGPV